jgi:hypothetical protein
MHICPKWKIMNKVGLSLFGRFASSNINIEKMKERKLFHWVRLDNTLLMSLI